MRDIDPSDAVRALAASGRKIQAIKQLRQETGLGLKEAKEAVEALDIEPASGEAAVTAPEQRDVGQPTRNGSWILAATLVGLAGVIVCGGGRLRAELASDWPVTEGVIVDGHLHDGFDDPARWIVEYVFEVDGRPYTGSRISYTNVWGMGQTRAAMERYPVGARTTVHYDPADPSRAVLELEPPWIHTVVTIVATASLVLGITGWIRYAREERRAAAFARRTAPA